MGQTYSAMRGSQSAVLGEVVVGLEALAMLESPEEHSSTVMRMASPQIPLHKGQLTPSAKGGSGRVRRALGITEEEDEDEDEAGEKEGPFSSPVPSLRRTQQKRRVEVSDELLFALTFKSSQPFITRHLIIYSLNSCHFYVHCHHCLSPHFHHFLLALPLSVTNGL